MEQRDGREVIVACKALTQEIDYVQDKLGTSIPVIWVDRGLHNVPSKLNEAVQETLDALEDVDRVLLGYANCGNAIKGVQARDFEIIIPKVDDCISILFNSQKAARKAKMDADKEACRAEDQANGVYYLPNAPKGKEGQINADPENIVKDTGFIDAAV